MVGRYRTIVQGSLYLGLLAEFTLPGVSDSFSRAPQNDDLIFSHRNHLARQGTECIQCHASVTRSKTADDRNLPQEKNCLGCHEGARARNECSLCHRNPEKVVPRPPARRTFHFNHQLHLSFGNVAPALASAIDSGRYLSPSGDIRRYLNTENLCEACHRRVAETDLTTSAHLPRMADCLVCHSKIDPPFSCGYCHTREQELKPANHTPSFADTHSSRKAVPDKTSCKVCHGVKFTCMGCH